MLEALGLIEDRLHHIRMTVSTANRRDSAKSVQIPTAFVIEQVLLLSIYHKQLSKRNTRKQSVLPIKNTNTWTSVSETKIRSGRLLSYGNKKQAKMALEIKTYTSLRNYNT